MIDDTAAATTLHSGRLTVCTYGGFAPVCFKDAAGGLAGLDISFLARFAESEGLAVGRGVRQFERRGDEVLVHSGKFLFDGAPRPAHEDVVPAEVVVERLVQGPSLKLRNPPVGVRRDAYRVVPLRHP